MKRYTPIIDGLEKEFKAILEVTDDGELLKRSEVLRALALNTEYFAAINLGYSEEEYEAELTRLENRNG